MPQKNRARSMTAPLLEIKNLSREFAQSYGLMGSRRLSIKAVQNVSLRLYKGHTLGIVGESGSGKSTLAKMAARLLNPHSGDVLLDGVSIFSGPPEFIASLPAHLQMVFQDPYSSLNPRMRIGSSIAEPLLCAGMPARKRSERVKELLLQVGLQPEQAGLYPHEFSGGQRQRIALARAIALKPDLIICDEPVSSLDASVQAQVLNLLKELQDAHSPAYMFISHDLAVISHMSDQVAVMYLGQIVEYTEACELFSAPAHPYTMMLLEAASNKTVMDARKERPQGQSGGCLYLNRCPKVRKDCAETTPELAEQKPGHFVRCLFA